MNRAEVAAAVADIASRFTWTADRGVFDDWSIPDVALGRKIENDCDGFLLAVLALLCGGPWAARWALFTGRARVYRTSYAGRGHAVGAILTDDGELLFDNTQAKAGAPMALEDYEAHPQFGRLRRRTRFELALKFAPLLTAFGSAGLLVAALLSLPAIFGR